MRTRFIPEKYRSTVTEIVHYAAPALLAMAFVVFLFQQEWSSAFYTALIFGLMAIPPLLKRRFELFLPYELEIAATLFAFFALFMGSLLNFYEQYAWWDGVLHFHSGILLGIAGFVMIYVLNEQKRRKLGLSPGFVSFFAVCFSLAVSVLWELFEYFMDTQFGLRMLEDGIPDTMSDFIVNGLGAIIVAVIGFFWMKRHERIPMTPKTIS